MKNKTKLKVLGTLIIGVTFCTMSAWATNITISAKTKNDILNLNKLIIKNQRTTGMTLESSSAGNTIKIESNPGSSYKGVTLLGSSKIYVREICDDQGKNCKTVANLGAGGGGSISPITINGTDGYLCKKQGTGLSCTTNISGRVGKICRMGANGNLTCDVEPTNTGGGGGGTTPGGSSLREMGNFLNKNVLLTKPRNTNVLIGDNNSNAKRLILTSNGASGSPSIEFSDQLTLKLSTATLTSILTDNLIQLKSNRANIYAPYNYDYTNFGNKTFIQMGGPLFLWHGKQGTNPNGILIYATGTADTVCGQDPTRHSEILGTNYLVVGKNQGSYALFRKDGVSINTTIKDNNINKELATLNVNGSIKVGNCSPSPCNENNIGTIIYKNNELMVCKIATDGKYKWHKVLTQETTTTVNPCQKVDAYVTPITVSVNQEPCR